MVVPEVVLLLAGWKGGRSKHTLTLGLHLLLSWEVTGCCVTVVREEEV